MGWKNTQEFQKWQQRRSDRMNKQGREFELEVEKLLGKMRDRGEIASFVRHPPNSRADQDGKDFTVRRGEGERAIERDFGVTISLGSWQRARLAHPAVPQLCFPIGTKPETIVRRILQLFE